MTNDEIEEIRARHKNAERDSADDLAWFSAREYHVDRATLLAEVERLRAEIERLHKEADLTREALGGWALVPPDGGANPTHERVAAVVAEVELLTRERNEARAENERLREALRWYADPRNHFAIERRSPGDPDPAVIILDEPPIMSDNGKRARKALEAKR